MSEHQRNDDFYIKSEDDSSNSNIDLGIIIKNKYTPANQQLYTIEGPMLTTLESFD